MENQNQVGKRHLHLDNNFKGKKEKTVFKSKNIIFCTILFIIFTSKVFGQIKIGYVLSERIRTEYEEFKEAESQLQLELKKVQAELEKIAIKLDSLNQDYEVKRLMALDKGESIRKEMEQLELQGRKFQQEQFDPQNGQLMRKQAQMEFKILGKVKEAVQKVAIDSGFDYVMDASIGLLYVKPKFDITDEVLHELRNLTKDN
jgi:outer membrane protein